MANQSNNNLALLLFELDKFPNLHQYRQSKLYKHRAEDLQMHYELEYKHVFDCLAHAIFDNFYQA